MFMMPMPPTSSEMDANQVVIVCGETGSGKTTQLPKICESDIDVEMISVEVFEGKCKEEAFAKLNRNG